MADEIHCLTCQTTVRHIPGQIVGCGCDPDAPTWCWIDPHGRARGLSCAEWEYL